MEQVKTPSPFSTKRSLALNQPVRAVGSTERINPTPPSQHLPLLQGGGRFEMGCSSFNLGISSHTAFQSEFFSLSFTSTTFNFSFLLVSYFQD